MNIYTNKRTVCSLITLSIEEILCNLPKLEKDELLLELPMHIKNRMLRKFTTTSIFWNDPSVDFKHILTTLVNKHTEHLDLTCCLVDDDILKTIGCCQNLRELYLTSKGDNFITYKGLLNLIPHLKRIYHLRISNCDAMNDNVIDCISQHCPGLHGLDVGGCNKISDVSLISLSNMQHLLWLTFTKTQITDAGIYSLVKGPSGPKLLELRISECPNITERILNYISSNCASLQILAFHKCSKIQDHNCFSFQEGSLKNLKQLNWTIEW